MCNNLKKLKLKLKFVNTTFKKSVFPKCSKK